MPPEPSVTSACEGPRSCTLRYSSALLPKSFERPGPKSVSPATYCSGVEVVVWCRWIVDMRAPFASRSSRDSEFSFDYPSRYCSYRLSPIRIVYFRCQRSESPHLRLPASIDGLWRRPINFQADSRREDQNRAMSEMPPIIRRAPMILHRFIACTGM